MQSVYNKEEPPDMRTVTVTINGWFKRIYTSPITDGNSYIGRTHSYAEKEYMEDPDHKPIESILFSVKREG